MRLRVDVRLQGLEKADRDEQAEDKGRHGDQDKRKLGTHVPVIGREARAVEPNIRAVSYEPLTDEQREIRDLIRDLSRERVAPRAAEIDKSAEFPWDVVELFREHELFGLMFDEEYGGAGESALMTLVAIEEVSKVCATSGLILAVQELGSLGIKLAGNDEQKRRFLPRLASGEWLPAYALTEPGSGSDSAAMRSEARREGDGYVLNGSKRFITNAGVAGLYVVFAKTDPEGGHAGISAFVVEADTPGFEVGRIEPKMGIKGSTTGELFFNDMVVPADNLLGEEGDGFRIAMRILDRSRPGIGAQGLGLAQGATDLGYFGAAAKCFASDVAMEVTTDAVQLFGGYGYVKDYPVERMMRDAKITQIYEGTNQVQRVVIARALGKRGQAPG